MRKIKMPARRPAKSKELLVMKKLFAVLLMFICCISLFGCGVSPKEEAEKFHEKYYKQEMKAFFQEHEKIAKESYSKYGNTQAGDKAFIANFHYADKLNNIINKVNNEKFENQEIIPLKDYFINILTETNKFYDILASNDKANYNSSQRDVLKAAFKYNNEYSKITTGKGIPVMNTNIGQLYAYTASDVAFAITDIRTAKRVGNEYFSKEAQGKFILVKIMSFNNQKDAVTIDSNLFKLINKNNQEYSASNEGMTALQLSNGNADGFLQQVNPGMGIEVVYVFDVPANTAPKDYKLQARGGMTGDKVDIPLKINKTGY